MVPESTSISGMLQDAFRDLISDMVPNWLLTIKADMHVVPVVQKRTMIYAFR